MAKKPGKDARASAQNARIFNRDCWRCVYCPYDGRDAARCAFLEVDHLDPTIEEADDYDQEFDEWKVTACSYCNKLKGDFEPAGNTRDKKLRDATAYVDRRRKNLVEWFDKNYVAIERQT